MTRLAQFGGLHVSRVDVSALPLPITVSPTGPSIKWRLTMTGPGGGPLIEDAETKLMEVQEVFLVLDHEWE